MFSYVWWERAFHSEVWVYWGHWETWKPHQDKQYCKSCPSLVLHGLCKKWKQPVATASFMEALRVRCLLISWWMFLMPAKMQDWKLLPLCVTWVPTNCWVCQKWHLSSDFRIEKLWLYLILPISLNVPATFS